MQRKYLLYGVVFFFFCYFIYKNTSSSLFLQDKERLNIVFYGENTLFFSLSQGDVDYVIPFSSELEVLIPGGYGTYKIGALGKLASLEKKPEIYKKTFSVNTSSFVDMYFYSNNPVVYYGKNAHFQKNPSLSEIFFLRSNATILDRILLYSYFINKRVNQFTLIDDLPAKKKEDRTFFDREEFFKIYQGYFYKKTYRKENNSVQLLYTKSHSTAQLISHMLEGEGIHVVDISQTKRTVKSCVIIKGSSYISDTANGIGRFFHCTTQNEKTDISDIVVYIGLLEKEWGIE